MSPHTARVLAQLVHGPRAMNLTALAESLGWAPDETKDEVDKLTRARLVTTERVIGARWILYRATDAGRREAGAGETQLAIVDAPERAPVASQPALF